MIVARNTQAYVTMVRRLAMPHLTPQLWRSAFGGPRQVVRMIPPPVVGGTSPATLRRLSEYADWLGTAEASRSSGLPYASAGRGPHVAGPRQVVG